MKRLLCCCSAPRAQYFLESPDGQGLNAAALRKGRAADSKPEFVTAGAGSLMHRNVSDPSRSNLIGVKGSVLDTSAASAQPLKRRIDWVIGLDFGTTFSGFAFASASGNTEISVHYNWPRNRNENAYCKTVTGLYYRKKKGGSKLECSSWGYPARSDFLDPRKHGDAASEGKYLTRFKMLLKRDLDDPELAASIPQPLTAMSIITDYLRLLGEYALEVVQSHHLALGDRKFSKESVQWVVTVPSIWDENAKQQMKVCMVNAGLMGLGGIDAVNVVLEPEAASCHCHEELRKKVETLRTEDEKFSLNTGDKILVADVGGGTVDIVVQEMVGNRKTFQVQELTESSGGLCGGTYVDASFMRHLFQKIPCLEDYLGKNSYYKAQLQKDCEEIKCVFGQDSMSDTVTKALHLPNELADQWEAYEARRGNTLEDSSLVELTQQDLSSIFAPVVADILSLIAAKLAQVPDIKVMFVVGGFADSPHLMRCIHERFCKEVPHIVNPVNPGSAIAQGAVYLGLHPEAIVSRIAKKTYGTTAVRPFEHGRDPLRLLSVRNGQDYCSNGFDVYVRRGDRVKVNMSLTKAYTPVTINQRVMEFDLWSSSMKEPRYTDEGEGATKEGAFEVTLPGAAANVLPRFEMTMSFGKGHIEVRAVGSVSGEPRSIKLPVKYCA